MSGFMQDGNISLLMQKTWEPRIGPLLLLKAPDQDDANNT